jgi:hypothetical protein
VIEIKVRGFFFKLLISLSLTPRATGAMAPCRARGARHAPGPPLLSSARKEEKRSTAPRRSPAPTYPPPIFSLVSSLSLPTVPHPSSPSPVHRRDSRAPGANRSAPRVSPHPPLRPRRRNHAGRPRITAAVDFPADPSWPSLAHRRRYRTPRAKPSLSLAPPWSSPPSYPGDWSGTSGIDAAIPVFSSRPRASSATSSPSPCTSGRAEASPATRVSLPYDFPWVPCSCAHRSRRSR